MKFSKTLLLSTLLSTASFNVLANSQQEQFVQAAMTYQQGNYQKTYEILLSLAEQGYAKAQFTLGGMYDDGIGIKQDYHQAVKWYQKAAEQGNTDAQLNLGNMYSDGKGVKQDYHKAVKWFQKAAKQGNAKALYNLGEMYFKGKGVRQNRAKAKELAGKSCDNGYQGGCDIYRMLNEQK